VHWVAWDIPAGVTDIAAGGALPDGARSGRNDAGAPGYTGPCPPIGRHRYFFKLYALDAVLGDLGEAPTKADVERAMEGHVLEQAQTVGTYQRGGA
jgi:Raf kinase inhibitor-like YbhB/YbcL family protein